MFGCEIRRLRENKGLTQSDLAQSLGYQSSSIIAMWESGERKPPSTKLPALARALDCTIDELFVDETNAASDS